MTPPRPAPEHDDELVHAHQDELVDEASEGSFPASDPPSSAYTPQAGHDPSGEDVRTTPGR